MSALDPFERRLTQVPLRSVPPELRAKVLGCTPGDKSFWGRYPSFLELVRFVFCPSPRLAGLLGVAWALIVGLNLLSLPPGSRSQPESSLNSGVPTVSRMAWLEQQRLRTELLNEERRVSAPPPSHPAPADRPRSAAATLIRTC